MSRLLIPVAAMAIVVVASNVLVQHPVQMWGLEDYLTWGAFTYPFAFLVTDLTNRRFGPAAARRVVYVGFACAVVLSFVLATPRIAIASGAAFLTAQLADVAIFNLLRHKAWWRAPLTSSFISGGVDTAIFFTLAFAATGLPSAEYAGLALPVWIGWAFFDYLVKMGHAVVMLVPFRAISLRFQRTAGQPA
ncbi:queuosine precursor transporter [Lutibaculum baratangense]|uniref:Probable queuosine precursor transporter n=1 Tax=Lutibaculum baratangense AMV1 TaxID=631454 RepID=V4TCT6_9HYPH|nr:queuosine precursor transporter [Lutibaculum baratangense]ESR24113.1 putative preQ0 transporter [Lutibaculum baratangense AMV1]